MEKERDSRLDVKLKKAAVRPFIIRLVLPAEAAGFMSSREKFRPR